MLKLIDWCMSALKRESLRPDSRRRKTPNSARGKNFLAGLDRVDAQAHELLHVGIENVKVSDQNQHAEEDFLAGVEGFESQAPQLLHVGIETRTSPTKISTLRKISLLK